MKTCCQCYHCDDRIPLLQLVLVHHEYAWCTERPATTCCHCFKLCLFTTNMHGIQKGPHQPKHQGAPACFKPNCANSAGQTAASCAGVNRARMLLICNIWQTLHMMAATGNNLARVATLGQVFPDDMKSSPRFLQNGTPCYLWICAYTYIVIRSRTPVVYASQSMHAFVNSTAARRYPITTTGLVCDARNPFHALSLLYRSLRALGYSVDFVSPARIPYMPP